jgi:hypothetical protein
MNGNWKRTLLANCKKPFFVCFALAVLGTPGDSNNELAAQLKGAAAQRQAICKLQADYSRCSELYDQRRRSIRPQQASQPRSNCRVYANAEFYTDDTSYHGRESSGSRRCNDSKDTLATPSSTAFDTLLIRVTAFGALRLSTA